MPPTPMQPIVMRLDGAFFPNKRPGTIMDAATVVEVRRNCRRLMVFMAKVGV
jgi:hypothetical protein